MPSPILSPVRGHSSRVPTRLDMLRNLDNPSAASSSSCHSPVPSVAAKLMHRPGQRETPARSERERESEVKYVSTPRFHRVRLAPTSEENELSPSSSSSSPKLWWFSNLFSRRPSVSDKPMNATINTNATKSGSGGGIYSRKSNTELSNAVNQALASLDIHFQQKGDVWTAEYPTQPRVPEKTHTRRRSSAGLIGMSINASIFSADRKPPVPPADNGSSSLSAATSDTPSSAADSPGGPIKFTIEIAQDREDPELKCIHFQHKKGDPVVYQRLQKELQTKLHV